MTGRTNLQLLSSLGLPVEREGGRGSQSAIQTRPLAQNGACMQGSVQSVICGASHLVLACKCAAVLLVVDAQACIMRLRL